MNSNISNELLEIFNNKELVFNFCVIIIYFFVSIWYLKICIDKAKKLDDNFLYEFAKIREGLYKNRPRNKDAKDLYLTPLQAGVFIDKEIKIYHIIATILHFLDLGIIKLEKIYRNDKTFAYRLSKNEMEFCNYNLYANKKLTNEVWEKLKKRGISISEICLIDRIVFKYYNHINADRIFELYDSKDDFSKLYNLRKIDERKELQEDKAKVKAHIYNEFETLGLYNFKHDVHVLLGIWPTKLYFYEIMQLREYKNKLQYDTLLSERSIENIYLWGEHLIYGVTFNVCKTSIKDAIDIYEGKRKK